MIINFKIKEKILKKSEFYIISNNDANVSYYKCTYDKGNEQKYHTNGDIME